MLKRKKGIVNHEWVRAFRNIEQTVTKQEIDNLIDKTVEDIKKQTKNKDTVYAWSGGKDSIALAFVVEKAGIHEGLCTICDLEYPAFKEWLLMNKPKGITIINTKQDLDWLSENEHMLFPDSKRRSRWFSIVQHKGQRYYTKKRQAEVLILGRRIADGNYVGKRKGENSYIDREGFIRFSPISDWRHEDVLALIHYYELDLPPIYYWSNGFKNGTHPWPARPHTKNVQDGWRQIYEIDPSIVLKASTKIDSAKKFLDEIGVGK